MNTNLFTPIETPEQATNYICELYKNGELYHFDDNAEDVIWQCGQPSAEELKQLDINRDKLFDLLEDPFETVAKLLELL